MAMFDPLKVQVTVTGSIRELVTSVLARQPDMCPVEAAPDVVVLHGGQGWDAEGGALPSLQDTQRPPRTVALVLGGYDEIAAALRNGVHSLFALTDPSEELVEAIRHAAAGKPFCSSQVQKTLLEAVLAAKLMPGDRRHVAVRPLTLREHEVAWLVAQLLSDDEIAARLSISVNTVKTHLRHIRRKLGVEKRRQLARALHPELWDEMEPPPASPLLIPTLQRRR